MASLFPRFSTDLEIYDWTLHCTCNYRTDMIWLHQYVVRLSSAKIELLIILIVKYLQCNRSLEYQKVNYTVNFSEHIIFLSPPWKWNKKLRHNYRWQYMQSSSINGCSLLHILPGSFLLIGNGALIHVWGIIFLKFIDINFSRSSVIFNHSLQHIFHR